MNAWVSELIKTRAYRLTAWLLPAVAAVMTAVGAFSLVSASEAVGRGAPLAAQLETVAFAPGSGTFFSGLLVGIFAAVVVTADFSSGVVNLSLMASGRRPLFVAKLATGLLAALAASVVGSLGVGLAAAGLLPADLFWRASAAPVLWGNLLGVLTSHLAWAAMGAAAAFGLRRSAPALGTLLGLVLAPPALAATLRGFGQTTAAGLVDLLPPGLMQAATLTGADSVSSVGPVPASLGLLVWCGVGVLVSWAAFGRSRAAA